jgi:hypothetical protein
MPSAADLVEAATDIAWLARRSGTRVPFPASIMPPAGMPTAPTVSDIVVVTNPASSESLERGRVPDPTGDGI